VVSGQSPLRHRTTVSLTNRVHQEGSRSDDDGLDWLTIEEAAQLCRRSPGTIRNLVSKYQLRRRLAWTTRRRLRHRVVMLSPNVAMWLQRITLFRQREYLEHPPR